MEYEIWKDIPDFERRYQVSNFGRLKSMNYMHTGKEQVMKTCILKSGYETAVLCKNNIGKRYYVHRLVWETFNGPIPDGLQINHIDENPLNNHLDNLNLMTPKENTNWGKGNTNRHNKQINNPAFSKWVIQLTKNNEILHFYPSLAQAERETGVDKTSICSCCKNKLKTAGTVRGNKYIWKYVDNF